MPMTPWWVILVGRHPPAPGTLSVSRLNDQLNRYLTAWTRRTLGRDGSWWALDTWSPSEATDAEGLVDNIRSFIERCNPLAHGRFQDVSMERLGVAVVGDGLDPCVRVYAHTVAGVLRAKAREWFPGIPGLVLCGFFFIPYEPSRIPDDGRLPLLRFFVELHTMMGHSIRAFRPFDHVVIVQDANFSDNPQGYRDLPEDEKTAALAISLAHWAIAYDLLARAIEPGEAVYWGTSGVFLDYDRDGFLDRIGRHIGDRLIAALKDRLEEEEARRACASLDEWLQVPRLFQQTIAGRPAFALPSRLWAGARTREGRQLSPWHFWRLELLTDYFRQFLRTYPFRLREYMQVFIVRSLQRFRAFLKERQIRQWEGADGLRQRIDDLMARVLAGYYGPTRTLGQLRRISRILREKMAPEQVVASVEALEDFQRLEVFQVPDFLKEFYASAPDRWDPRQEQRWLQEIREAIQGHPIPLSLFLRAVLIGVVLAWGGPSIARALSPQVIDLEWLLQVPYLLPGLLGAVPLLMAFWRYQVRTLNRIRKWTLRYVAAVLRHVQTEAKQMVRQAIVDLLRQAQAYCETWEKRIEAVQSSLQYPSRNGSSYPETVFIRPLTGTVVIPGQTVETRILSDDLRVQWPMAGASRDIEELTEEDVRRLMNEWLDSHRGDQKVHEFLYQAFGDSSRISELVEDLRRWIEDRLTPEVPDTVDQLLRRAGGIRPEAWEPLWTLAWPAVVWDPARPPQPVTCWVVSSVDNLQPAQSARLNIRPIRDDRFRWGIALQTLRKIERLLDVAIIGALWNSSAMGEFDWDKPSTVVALALTQPDGLRPLDDGQPRPVASGVQQKVNKLRESLGFGEEATPGLLEV